MVVGNLLCCNMTALRSDNAHDMVSMYLVQPAGSRDVMSGFLAGVGTEVKIPVAMPIVAIRLVDVDKSINELGDLGDEAILRAYGQVKTELGPVGERLHKILLTQMPPITFRASVVNPEIRHEFHNGTSLVQEDVRRFCKRLHQ